MVEKIIVLLILYIVVWCSDGPKLKQKNRRERITYGAIMLVTVYLSLDYVFELGWPNFIELINLVLSDVSKKIVESLKVPA
ncbi:hypothetical protein ACQKGA_29435 [Priestia megaterium]|uniref:hypothetical protein n=1 Tax=Bacillaceae TaxID=186817 RepID=UPI000BA5EAD7|nr:MULTISPECIES: hypothetical protein [Bacillaceae]MEC1903559.1 hypothetical protein [Bacillus atrophaeus]MEC2399413.1 hypothetical protein [Bacillus atrophaeus]MED4437623.1 hypothetical protein [Bacillus atrophaeus]MED4567153.1 hypothetical protein [Bacillus atrophaeus]MED4778824.1 hypothetical protein [Bacillus atrophaeus]